MKILFLSGIDFKEKSIQVIQKTPQAYVAAGHEVVWVVGRDTVQGGNYSYEPIINPKGVDVERFEWPLKNWRHKAPRVLKLAITKVASLVVILRLFAISRRLLRGDDFDLVYGYEVHGVLASMLLRRLDRPDLPFVSRFQGTLIGEVLDGSGYARKLFYLDHIVALKYATDVVIMTDDGTDGEAVLRRLGNSVPVLFIRNGTDFNLSNKGFRSAKKRRLHGLKFICVSRLVPWKRVDLSLDVFKCVSEIFPGDCSLIIVGDGECLPALQQKVVDCDIQKSVVFTGAVENSAVENLMRGSDFFISMYSLSNVGNPLFEAMACGCVPITLANGSTPEWIQHLHNGFIYENDAELLDKIERDFQELLRKPEIYDSIRDSLILDAERRLYGWEKRFELEMKFVRQLVYQ